MSNGNSDDTSLSSKFRRAYEVSYRASPDDTDSTVSEARKTLRSLRTKMKTKLKDVGEICEACSVVSKVHSHMAGIRDHACGVAQLVRRDTWLLERELQRIKK